MVIAEKWVSFPKKGGVAPQAQKQALLILLMIPSKSQSLNPD